MDLTELSALDGQEMTPEQRTAAFKLIEGSFKKVWTDIRQDGYRAGLSTTKAIYENDGEGSLDKAFASIKMHDAIVAERDEQIARLSEEKPDVAVIQAEHNLVVKELQKKNVSLSDDLETTKAEHTATLSAKNRQIVEADLERLFQRMNLKPRELRFAISETKARLKDDAGQWKVYAEDGRTPLLVDDTTTPIEVLAASYADGLPRDAFLDKRSLGLGGDYKAGDGESKTMKMSDFDAKSVGEQAAIGKQVADGKLQLVD